MIITAAPPPRFHSCLVEGVPLFCKICLSAKIDLFSHHPLSRFMKKLPQKKLVSFARNVRGGRGLVWQTRCGGTGKRTHKSSWQVPEPSLAHEAHYTIAIAPPSHKRTFFSVSSFRTVEIKTSPEIYSTRRKMKKTHRSNKTFRLTITVIHRFFISNLSAKRPCFYAGEESFELYFIRRAYADRLPD